VKCRRRRAARLLFTTTTQRLTAVLTIHMNLRNDLRRRVVVRANVHLVDLPMAKTLTSLLGPNADVVGDAQACVIEGMTADSRAVVPGSLFAALPGVKTDGAGYIADALAKGAAALLVGSDAPVPHEYSVPIVRAREPRLALALMAARFFGPGPETIVAITGTSGKTSVAEFTRQIYARLGHKAASLGTIGVVKPDGAVYGSLTTPDPITLARTLAELRAEGVTHLAMEASSHGLDQHRLDGVRLKVGAFTNLGRDHLDYHPTVDAYLEAKLRLFLTLLPPGSTAVVNADDARSMEVMETARRRSLDLMTVGEAGKALRLVRVTPEGFGQRLEIEHQGRRYHATLPLVGAYQASNALVAAALALATGENLEAVLAALTTISGVKGRLEIIGEARGGLAVVDYAHKPEALAAALDALRPFATGKLICVFGCGGDRDRGKRPIMGAISVDKADVTIITDDNPRTEIASAIRSEVLAGAVGASEIGDRAEAIRAAIAMMGPGDVVLVAGKGHETGQIVGDTVLPFSDHDVVAAALAAVPA
jgi:UDP-N-acetylmuramoyl-L-alanyl-D-glutamate--2,6-diaminopimelate ligase